MRCNRTSAWRAVPWWASTLAMAMRENTGSSDEVAEELYGGFRAGEWKFADAGTTSSVRGSSWTVTSTNTRMAPAEIGPRTAISGPGDPRLGSPALEVPELHLADDLGDFRADHVSFGTTSMTR